MGGKMASITKLSEHLNGEILRGHQLRYIYLIDKSCKITVPLIPFSEIQKRGAGMYKGIKTSAGSVTVAQQASSLQEGFNSTPALNNLNNAI